MRWFIASALANQDFEGIRTMRYKQLAVEIAGLIRRGDLAPGMRLPSVRQATKAYGVSPATVAHAYRSVEFQGLNETRPRAGFFVSVQAGQILPGSSFVRTTEVALTPETDDLLFHVLSSSNASGIVPLGAAFPSPAMFPSNQLDRSLASIARTMGAEAAFTELSSGNEGLRRQIGRRYMAAGMAVPTDEVVVTGGALEALSLCLQTITSPGDVVAIRTPAFYGALQALDRMRLKAVEIPMHPSGGLDVSLLADALKRHPIRACWFMTSFQNPTGASMPDTTKEALVALLAAHDVPLIEDDVYAELYFGASPVRPAKSFDRKGLVLHCGSFSKSLAPGYRVGWVAAGRFTQQIARAKSMTNISTSVPAQLAIADYLQSRSYDRHLRQFRQNLAAQQDNMVDAIERFFPSGTHVSRPKGGYFLWLELPVQVDSVRLFELSRKQGISNAPGPIFSGSGGYRNCIRLNYGHPWTHEIERGVETVGSLAHSLC
ncbi:PLP-dependent aminotransferase family protein [Paraburkholderia sediminicola]|uniref:aminotransferase-like domain-containing protein n=1 Tax=Paraburkholderia sediminicola TaxID=458836 RepID=UPI0038BA22CC